MRRGNLYLWSFEAPSSKNSASASAVVLLDFGVIPAAEIPGIWDVLVPAIIRNIFNFLNQLGYLIILEDSE